MAKRAAVVIGVGKTGALQPLKSPVAGAKAVASWLTGEDFEVSLITDEVGTVSARSIADEIDKYVKPPTRYSMLLIYFSGHGLFQARSDIWLLSEAPQRPDEAINLAGTIDLARCAGIPNIVIVSDACRSLPNDLGTALVRGVDAFPFYNGLSRSKVDVFRATLPANVAYEAEIDQTRRGKGQQSLLTAAWLSAYDNPPVQMQRPVTVGTDQIIVVPNRKLENYLQEEVDELLSSLGINLEQTIEAEVPSDDDVFIGRARVDIEKYKDAIAMRPRPAGANRGRKSKPRAVSEGELAAEFVRTTLGSQPKISRPLHDIKVSRGIRNVKNQITALLPTDAVTHFGTQTGFVVYGAIVTQVVTSRQGDGVHVSAELLEPGNFGDKPAIIRLWGVNHGATIAVEFSNGRSVILAALKGYIGHCTISTIGLSNVSYVPSTNHPRWIEYVNRRKVIDRLRAEVAVAAAHNTFSLASTEKAQKFAEEIRKNKSMDPTLGVYAAYAYAQAGNDDEILSIMNYMHGDLGVELFDVRMMAFRRPMGWGPDSYIPIFPACPMLTQGWSLLRARQVILPNVLEQGQRYLTGSLWATFEAMFTRELMKAFETGEL